MDIFNFSRMVDGDGSAAAVVKVAEIEVSSAAPRSIQSIVERAALRKKAKMEGYSPSRLSRRGDLDEEHLLAVALEDAEPLPAADIYALAAACDISADQVDAACSATAGGLPSSP